MEEIFILIAEDDIDDGEIIEASFARHPSFLNVDIVKNGKELLDIIALRCDFPIYKISGMLLNMELKGVIRPLPGKLFEAI